MNRELKYILPTRPDISFQLIFCFLDLKELTLIAQCSQDFRRMVTNRSFLNMIQNIDFDVSSAPKNSIASIICQFKLLRRLRLYNIKTKDIDISSIVQLKHLEILIIRVVSCINHKIIIDTVRLLPALRILDVQGLFDFNTIDHFYEFIGMTNLRLLCAQPGAPSSLTTIGSFGNDLSENQKIECAQLLERLPVFDTLEFDNDDHEYSSPISILFSKWVTQIIFQNRKFVDSDISALLYFNRINYIHLSHCSITNTLLKQLVTANVSRLKTLKLFNFVLNEDVNSISFKTISKCTELVILDLWNCGGLCSRELHLLNQCKKLNEIEICNCGLKMENLSLKQKKILKLRSHTFPSLTKCEIYDTIHDYDDC
jgi:hypothetical protein